MTDSRDARIEVREKITIEWAVYRDGKLVCVCTHQELAEQEAARERRKLND
jgi:hypothetical protein